MMKRNSGETLDVHGSDVTSCEECAWNCADVARMSNATVPGAHGWPAARSQQREISSVGDFISPR